MRFIKPQVLITIAVSTIILTPCPRAGAQAGGDTVDRNDLEPLTLEAALQIARVENPFLAAAAAGVEAAAGRAWQSGRWSNPNLELAVEEWPVSNGGSFSDAKQTLGVSQQLPWPRKKAYERERGQTGILLSQSEQALRMTEITRDVKAAFHRVLAAEASVEVGLDLLRIAQSSADTARKRVDSGAASYQEQLRAEIQLEQAQSAVADLRLDAVGARQSLFTLMGRPERVNTPVLGTLAPSCRQTLLTSPPEQWQPHHPSWTLATATLRLAELDSKRARLEPYPDVTASLAGGRMGDTDESIVEFGFSIPLPLLDSSKGRKAEAAARVSEAQAQLDAVGQALQREWSQATKRYRTAGEQAAAYREQILPRTREALRLVQTGFEEGKFDFIDLLDTQRTFAESQLAYQKRLLELNIAQAELEALIHPCPRADPAPTSP